MSIPAQSTTTSEHAAKMVCSKCKSKEMRRRSRTIFDQITSFYPYTCNRCGNSGRQFRLTVTAVVRVILLFALVGAGIWLWRDPSSFPSFRAGNAGNNAASAQQDQVEALARARTAAGGELSTFEQMMLRKPRIAMSNATVMKLVKANVGKEVVLQMIHTSNADYDLSANAIIELKDAGVDQAIILAMINASYAAR